MKTLSTASRVGALLALVAVMSCSRSAEGPRSTALPTSPSAANAFADPAADRVGAMAATFPTPDQALAFRQVLEAKFRAEGRPAQSTFVNAEGVIVWTLEYLRYRASGCSQTEAIAKVFTQIDRQGVPALCSSSLAETFPPQNESVEFRQLLETKYRDLGATSIQTVVPLASEVLYTIEFVRYTQSGCSGPTSYEKVFVQIDNRGVAPDCRPAPTTPSCTFGLQPATQSAPASGGTFSAAVTADPPECSWQLSADVPWISGTSSNGSGPRTVNYTVGTNPNTEARTGRITLLGSDGTQRSVPVTQAGSPTGPGPTPPSGPVSCTFATSPSTLNAIAEGGTYDIQVTAPAGCAWAAGSSASFVAILPGGSGSGNGSFRVRVDGNRLDSRQGTVEVRYTGGQQTVLVSQAAALLRAIIKAPASCQVDELCTFDGSASTGVITSYSWDFGDDETGTGVIVDHTYPFSYVSDDYPDYSIDTPVRLTVTGPRGSATATVIVTVFDGGRSGSTLDKLRSATKAAKPGGDD